LPPTLLLRLADGGLRRDRSSYTEVSEGQASLSLGERIKGEGAIAIFGLMFPRHMATVMSVKYICDKNITEL